MKEERPVERHIVLPSRPKGQYASKFRSTQLVSNHYKVDFKGSSCIYVICARFDPWISDDNRALRNKVFQAAHTKIREVVPEPVYSGMNIMSRLKPNFTQETQVSLNFDEQEYKLNLKIVRVLDFSNKSLSSQTQDFLILNFLNNQLRNFLRQLNFIEIGKSRKFFDAKKKTRIEGTNLTLFEGYAANFCFLESGLYLKVDAATKIVRTETVLDEIDRVYNIHDSKSKEEKRALLKEALIGKTIMANYGNSRCWRIDDLEFDKPIDEYKMDEAQTLAEYYKTKYNITIKKMKQPLLKVQDKRQQKVTLLIPELCLMTGLPDDVDERKRRQVSKYTIRPANDRKERIEDLIKRMNRQLKSGLTPKLMSEQLGITIEEKLHKVQARNIPMPNLQLGDRSSVEEGRQANFRLFDKPLYSTKVPLKICCIYFRSFDAKGLERLFQSTAKSFKINLEFKPVDLGDFSSRKGLDSLIDELKHRAKKDYNLYLIVLPTPLKTSYKTIKKVCLLELKIISQMVTEATLQRKEFQSIATKVLLQMAAKVGNTLWVPRIPQTLKNAKIMIVGVDSSSDAHSKGKIIGFCASINSTYTKFFSSTISQQSNSTILEKMREMLVKSIKAFTDQNGEAPDEVIVLRDGCGAGEIVTIKDVEVAECLEALKLVQRKSVALTYIIIDKKVTQKFFSSSGGGANNPSAGTLVNSDLVSSNYDFYLISQFSNRGTTVPTYYKVIYTDSKLEEGKLQELLYGQCYNYVNWTGSIKIPAPVQYAKKLCAFVSQYINEDVDSLNNSLYYI